MLGKDVGMKSASNVSSEMVGTTGQGRVKYPVM